MVDAVLGHDEDGPLGAQLALEQGLGDGPGCASRLAVGHAPPARALTLGDIRSFRHLAQARLDHVTHACRIGGQRLAAAPDGTAVRACLDIHRRHAEFRPDAHGATTLPGFMMLWGSSARLSVRISAISTGDL